MASPSNKKPSEASIIAMNKKIVELKKKIQLAEGQKKAYTEEWKEEQKNNSERISDLKKNIKEITCKLTSLNNPGNKKLLQKQPQDFIKRLPLPPGAKNVDEAVHILDLKVIDIKKQLDLMHDKYTKRQKHFNKLVEEYHMLMAYKNRDVNSNPSETIEEDANRKLVCHLENEIHRTSVQWMEAEHIRKKYRAIKSSLLSDSEKFESSLIELEESIAEQQAEINRLQEINSEALQMRDATKMILQRQEQSAHGATKSRERQSLDFRKLVEERKMELERLERKVFSSGKTLVHQESTASNSDDHRTDKSQPDDPNDLTKRTTTVMELQFKKLMEATGATGASEVLARYLTQREATTRLNYLRNTAETEKKHLEVQRELLNSQLEEFKFADIKEGEVNQEELEKLKNSITEQIERKRNCEIAAERTEKVISAIRESLVELLLKLQEIDEAVTAANKNKFEKTAEYNDLVSGNIPNEELLKMLEDKLKLGLITSGQLAPEEDSGVSEDDVESEQKPNELNVILPESPATQNIGYEEKERPPQFPPCYINLITGRGTQQASTSPGQSNQIPIASEDEGDVPSRSYLKRQAQIIVDAKSRRKGFRPPIPRRK